MILSLNSTPISRCNITGFQPYDVKEEFQMLAGNKRVDLVAQKQTLNINYALIKSDEFDVIQGIYETMAAVTVAYTDWNDAAVSFSAYMSPPQFLRRRTLSDGQWLIGQCTFTLSEL